LVLSVNAIGQLKMTRDNSRNGDVFVKGFPPQCVAIESQSHFLQFLFGSFSQKLESVRWKADDTSVGEFNIDHSLFCPSPNGGGFNGFIFSG
jgi:hypothetical protein